MRFYSFITFIACAAVLGAVPGGSSHAAQPQELILIHPGAARSLYDISAAEFGRRVNRKLPKTYHVTILSNPALGDGLALLDSVKNGRAAFVLASSAMVSLSDSFAVFELPFLIRNRDQVRAIRPALLNRFLQPEAERKGFRILGVWESGFRQFTNDVLPILAPNDFRGVKIALPPANIWREKLLRAFGAEPVPLASRALYEALQTQIVDGQEAPLAEIATSGLAENQHILSLSDHLYSPAFLVTSTAQLDAMPKQVRDIVVSEAVAMESWIERRAIALENDSLDRLDQTVKINNIHAGAFRKASRALYGEFVRAVPQGIQMIEAIQPPPEAPVAAHEAERLSLKPAQ